MLLELRPRALGLLFADPFWPTRLHDGSTSICGCVSKWYMTDDPQDMSPEPPLSLRRLIPDGPPSTVERFVEGLELTEASDSVGRSRPYLLLNMIATVDGRATLGGRSGPLGERADKELLYGLRTAVDAVMAGAGTIRAERYGPLIRDDAQRQTRRARGLSEEPLACIVS